MIGRSCHNHWRQRSSVANAEGRARVVGGSTSSRHTLEAKCRLSCATVAVSILVVLSIFTASTIDEMYLMTNERETTEEIFHNSTIQTLLGKFHRSSTAKLRYFNENSTFPYFQESLYPRYTPLELIFQPTVPVPANSTSTRTTSLSHLQDHPYAVCNFRQRGMHFPHFFQEFLRCVSWWRANNHNGIRIDNRQKQAVFIFRTDTNRRIGRSNWVNGLLPILESQPPFHLLIDRNGTYRDSSVYGAVPAVHDLYNQYAPSKRKGKRRSAYKPGDSIPPAFEMAHPQDAVELQRAVWNGLGLSHVAKGGCPTGHISDKQFPIIGFLNRHLDNGRHYVDYNAIEQALQAAFGMPEFRLEYRDSFDGLSFLEQVEYMANIDIVMGPHGAQLTNAAFLPQCGGLLEFFPQGYWAPHYFGTMARSTGHYHFGIYAGPRSTMDQDVIYAMTNTLQTQDEARARNITVENVQEVVDATLALVEQWQTCCRDGI
jgi:Glycosyltransferase 61